MGSTGETGIGVDTKTDRQWAEASDRTGEVRRCRNRASAVKADEMRNSVGETVACLQAEIFSNVITQWTFTESCKFE